MHHSFAVCQSTNEPARDLTLSLCRWHDPKIGRFISFDSYNAPSDQPLDLHKYVYARNDPVDRYDPTGKFSTTEFIVTGAIIGGIVGLTAGAYIGYKKSGQLLSWQTFEYSLIGLASGAAIGALIGAGIGTIVNGAVPFNSFSSIAKISSKLIQTVARGKLMRVTPATFIGGVIAGAVTEYITPDRFQEPVGIATLLALPANSAALLIYDALVTRVPGAAQESIAFVAGFNVGYFGAKNLGELPDAIKHIPDLF